MKNTQGVYFKRRSILTAVLLLMSFVGVANASLSGIPSGYPRFISTDNLFYDKNGNTGVVSFNSDSVAWQTSAGVYPEDVFNASFDVNVNLANLSNPFVTSGSNISIFGDIASLGTGDVSLFTADITSVGWTTGTGAIIEFVMDGSSMAGAVCDLGYCSYVDEVLQFTLDRNFDGKWRRNFKRSALAVATVPVPAAVWLMGSALVGLVGVGRRKQVV